MMRQIAAKHRGDKSPRLHWHCDKAACAYFIAEIYRTHSNWFEFVRQIAAAKFCRSDNDFHMSHETICYSNLSRRRVAAICRIVCLGLKFQAQVGLASTTEFLKLAEQFRNETNYTVWSDLTASLSNLAKLLQNTGFYSSFQTFCVKLYEQVASKVGWDPKEGEGNFTTQKLKMFLFCVR